MKKLQYLQIRFQKGATAVEYGLIVGLIAVALVVVLTSMGGGLNSLFTTVSTAITNAGK